MENSINQHNEEQGLSFGNLNEKSELMQCFEHQVHDLEWAYKDLLKEIIFGDSNYQA